MAPNLSAAAPAFRQAGSLGDEALDAATWRGFGDPVLDGLIIRARDANLDVRIAGQRVLQARSGSKACLQGMHRGPGRRVRRTRERGGQDAASAL